MNMVCSLLENFVSFNFSDIYHILSKLNVIDLMAFSWEFHHVSESGSEVIFDVFHQYILSLGMSRKYCV